jgi:hypothetical protein
LDEDTFGWLFIADKPLLYEKRHVARQLQIEAWLDLAEALMELNIERPTEGGIVSKLADYIV